MIKLQLQLRRTVHEIHEFELLLSLLNELLNLTAANDVFNNGDLQVQGQRNGCDECMKCEGRCDIINPTAPV